jgi:hypothetical protein
MAASFLVLMLCSAVVAVSLAARRCGQIPTERYVFPHSSPLPPEARISALRIRPFADGLL